MSGLTHGDAPLFFLYLVTADLTQEDHGQAECAMWHKWRKKSLLSCSWSLWQKALLYGAYSEALRSQSHPQELGISLKDSVHLELPKSWVFLGAKLWFQKVILIPGCANPEHSELMSSSLGAEKGSQDGPQSSIGAQGASGPAFLSAEFVSQLGPPLRSFHQTFKLSLKLHLLPAGTRKRRVTTGGFLSS